MKSNMVNILKNLSHREKVIWIELVTVVALFSYYFLSVARHVDGMTAAIWSYLTTVLWVVIIQVVAITILSAIEKPQPPDERDRSIEARAFKWSYYTAILGLVVALWKTAIGALANAAANTPEIPTKLVRILERHGETATPLFIVHVLLITLVLAEVVKNGVQLLGYRRGL